MKLPENIQQLFRVPLLTRTRIIAALAVAIAADSLQFLLGPLGWMLADQVIDFAVMVLTMWILGFHFLLLPTFVVELVPGIEELPTWTACVTAVIALRKRGQPAMPLQRPSDGNKIGLNQP